MWRDMYAQFYGLRDFLDSFGVVQLPIRLGGDREQATVFVNLGPTLLLGDWLPQPSLWSVDPRLPALMPGSSLFGPIPRVAAILAGGAWWDWSMARAAEPDDTGIERTFKALLLASVAVSPQAEYFLGLAGEIYRGIKRNILNHSGFTEAFVERQEWEKAEDVREFFERVMRRSRVLGEPRLFENVLLDIFARTSLRAMGGMILPSTFVKEESPYQAYRMYTSALRELKRQRGEILREWLRRAEESGDYSMPDNVRKELVLYTRRILDLEMVRFVYSTGNDELIDRFWKTFTW